MSYQLWVSAVTGRRRRGTTVAELRDIFDTRITTEVLFEPLKCCLASDLSDDVAFELRRLDFDVVGVKKEVGQPTFSFVRRENLKAGTCGEFAEPINVADLVAISTPLPELLKKLSNAQFAFVLSGSAIEGIVTRADLQKPPVRILLFSLISLLEMHLTYWISRVYPNESWVSQVSPSRLRKATELRQARRERKEDISAVECLQLCDKAAIVERTQRLFEIFGFDSKASAKVALQTVERVRDILAHSQFDLKAGTSWQGVIDLCSTVEKTLRRSEEAMERTENADLVAAD